MTTDSLKVSTDYQLRIDLNDLLPMNVTKQDVSSADISLLPKYGTIFGYTKNDIENSFLAYLEVL